MNSQNRVLPYTVQVCKNFSGENEEPLFCLGDPAYGEAYFPLSVKSGESLRFSVLNLYQNWDAPRLPSHVGPLVGGTAPAYLGRPSLLPAEDFSFFSMDGRGVVYDTLGYPDESNEVVITDTNKG